jgi:hypothetical protein
MPSYTAPNPPVVSTVPTIATSSSPARSIGTQFTKAPQVIHGMGLDHLHKRPAAVQQLRNKGLANAVSVEAAK